MILIIFSVLLRRIDARSNTERLLQAAREDSEAIHRKNDEERISLKKEIAAQRERALQQVFEEVQLVTRRAESDADEIVAQAKVKARQIEEDSQKKASDAKRDAEREASRIIEVC